MIKIKDLASKIGCDVYLPPTLDKEAMDRLQVDSVKPLRGAGPSSLSFLFDPTYKKELQTTQAAAVILKEKDEALGIIQLIHSNPRLAMARASQAFYDVLHTYEDCSSLAHVSSTAEVHPEAVLYPHCYIDEGAKIDKGCVIYPYVYIGKNSHVGSHSVIYPQVVIMDHCQIGQRVIIHGGSVIGSDGFGFVPGKQGHEKIPQIGSVIIEDDVEVGSLCSIDRATFNHTRIRKGSKLDSQVHVAHNVDVGEHAILCGGASIAGSSTLGSHVIAGGHAGIADRVHLGDGVMIGPKSLAIKSEKNPGEYVGNPVVPKKDWLRQVGALKKVPELLERVRVLEKAIKNLSGDQ